MVFENYGVRSEWRVIGGLYRRRRKGDELDLASFAGVQVTRYEAGEVGQREWF
jgi:hypothetical protein